MKQIRGELLLRKTNVTSRLEFTRSCITKLKPFGGKYCAAMKLKVKPTTTKGLTNESFIL